MEKLDWAEKVNYNGIWKCYWVSYVDPSKPTAHCSFEKLVSHILKPADSFVPIMADSGAGEALPEEAEEEDAELEGLKEWERINCARYISDSSPTGWSLVAIRGISADEAPGNPIVFPPANHENLHASASLVHHFIPQNHMKPSFSSPYPPSPWESSSSSSSLSSRSQFGIENDDSSYSFPPSESQLAEPEKSLPESPRPLAKPTVDSASWWNFVLKVLHSKFNGIEQLFRYISTVSGTIVSFISPIGRATVAAVVVMILYFRWRRRLNCGGESREQLIRMIEQKDERINQLLNQIAEMNQLLLALHRVENMFTPTVYELLVSPLWHPNVGVSKKHLLSFNQLSMEVPMSAMKPPFIHQHYYLWLRITCHRIRLTAAGLILNFVSSPTSNIF